MYEPDEIPRTYPNTKARPHNGDKVRVVNNRGEEVVVRVKKSRIKECNPRGHFVYFRGIPRGAPTCKEIECCELIEATTPRFDGYEPE